MERLGFQTNVELLRKQILPFGSAANSSSVSVGSVQVAVGKYLVAMCFQN